MALLRLTIGVSDKNYTFCWMPGKEKHGDKQIIFIDKIHLQNVVKDVTDEVGNFIRKWKNFEDLPLDDIRSAPPAVLDLLSSLKKSGESLYDALFPKCGSDTEYVQRYLKHYSRININFQAPITIPWGLICKIGTPKSEDYFDDFWGVKYIITVNPSDSSSCGQAAPLCNGDLLPILNWSLYEICMKELDGAEYELANRIYESAVPKPDENAELRHEPYFKNPEKLSKDLLYYIYSHHRNEFDSNGVSAFEFDTNKNNELKYTDFRRFLDDQSTSNKKSNSTGRTLFFLNGCSTSGYPVFYPLHSNNCIGFIVTEASIPRRFGLRFGQEVIDLWLQSEEPLSDVLHAISRKHPPLSLFYTLYCRDFYRLSTISPSVGLIDSTAIDDYRNQVADVNFSLDKAFSKHE